MTTFILAAALMVSIALGLLAWPLWQGRTTEGRGTLVALGIVVIALPLGAALMYRTSSNWSWDPSVTQGPAGQHSLDEAVVKLEARLKENPGDVDGWLLLARSHYVSQRFQKASEAYGRAYQLSGGQNLEAVVGYGETLALVDQNAMRAKAGELFEQALKMDPANQKALFYGGVAAAVGGRLPVARERWMTLLKQELPQEVKTVLVQRIQEVDQQLGKGPDPELAKYAATAAPPMSAMPAAAPEPRPRRRPPVPRPHPASSPYAFASAPRSPPSCPPGRRCSCWRATRRNRARRSAPSALRAPPCRWKCRSPSRTR